MLSLVVVGIVVVCIITRGVRIVFALALIGLIYYGLHHGIDLDNVTEFALSVASQATSALSSIDPVTWLQSLLQTGAE
ncbi:hypothetical protein [Salinisphaera sp. T31B1]|uniref:hypothetical protein n=1 Tax=Salinisphaera sp. T31B1 TaxID=727963 RepID=UPI003342CED5